MSERESERVSVGVRERERERERKRKRVYVWKRRLQSLKVVATRHYFSSCVPLLIPTARPKSTANGRKKYDGNVNDSCVEWIDFLPRWMFFDTSLRG